MEPPKPYMPDRFLKRVQVIEDEKTTRVRYDIADFGEFRWMEARFGGWEQSKGLRFRVKVDIFGASKGGMFLFVYVIFDNDPWTGHWTAQLQCTFRLLSQDGKKDLVSLQKSYTIDHTNYYVVAGFPIEEIRKKGSGLIMSTGTVRLQIDILWEGIQISNSYEQLLQYKEEVKAKDLLAVKVT
uniref:MATH domain-containing protein n=1 Tax=Parascaris univalens TaxID=6257 RepID=A0A915C754_PARUN